MRWLRKLVKRLRGTFQSEPLDLETQAEMEEHIALLAESHRQKGMTMEAATLAARRQFGNTTMLQEDRRAVRTFPALEALRGDLIFAARMLRKNPAFAAAAILTLALGVGANTAIFSVCNAVLFTPLPYADPGRIVMLWERLRDGAQITVAPANFVDWRNTSRSFTDMAAQRSSSFILGGQGEAVRVAGAHVSSNFFSTLGVPLALGRNFLAEEDQPGRNHVAVLSHRVWQEQFGANTHIPGTTITLNDSSYTVIGVLPADFQFGSSAADFLPRNQPDIWVPIALDLLKLQRGTHPLRVISRLNPGTTLTGAQAELDVMAANLERLYPEDNRDHGIVAVPLAQQVTANVTVALQTLFGAVGLVLLIACANVANLLLSRAAARQREMALRLALGATRARLAQQLLTESLLLASLGGIGGLLVARIAIAGLVSQLPADLARAAAISIDARMLVFTAAISLITGVLFGLGPLLGTSQANSAEALRETNRVAGGIQARLRHGLAVSQLAIAIILLIGAGLMGKSFWALIHVTPGFRSEHILTARLSLPKARYPDNARIAAFEQELADRLRATPGVESAGFATYLPLSGSDNGYAFFVEGRAPLPTGVFNFAKYRPVSAGYFETIGIPLRQGRSVTQADRADAPWVVVINESMAREFWGRENPIGQRLRFGSPTRRTVIGVVGDVLHEGLDGQLKPEMYVPVAQAPNTESGPTVVVRTARDAKRPAAALRETVSAMDRAVPVDHIETMEHVLSASVAQPRFRALVLAAFSLLALVIASIGIYGVMNYLVIQRTREFGIRLSMGAPRANVLRLVLGRAAMLIGVGTCVGLMGASLLVRLITKLLFETAPLDPLTFVMVPVLLGGVALAASYFPARRATRVDPMEALRAE